MKTQEQKYQLGNETTTNLQRVYNYMSKNGITELNSLKVTEEPAEETEESLEELIQAIEETKEATEVVKTKQKQLKKLRTDNN